METLRSTLVRLLIMDAKVDMDGPSFSWGLCQLTPQQMHATPLALCPGLALLKIAYTHTGTSTLADGQCGDRQKSMLHFVYQPAYVVDGPSVMATIAWLHPLLAVTPLLPQPWASTANRSSLTRLFRGVGALGMSAYCTHHDQPQVCLLNMCCPRRSRITLEVVPVMGRHPWNTIAHPCICLIRP